MEQNYQFPVRKIYFKTFFFGGKLIFIISFLSNKPKEATYLTLLHSKQYKIHLAHKKVVLNVFHAFLYWENSC